MEDLKSLVIGVVGGFIVLGVSSIRRAYTKKSLRDDIEFVEYEINHLSEMKRSSVEMNRSSFQALFAVLTLIAIANVVPVVTHLFGVDVVTKLGEYLQLLLWGAVLGLAVKFWRRYHNLKNFKEATAKLDRKLELLRSKYQKS